MTINLSEKIRGGTWIGTMKIEKTKTREHYTVTGTNETECFKKIYKSYERPLRYCNGYFIELDDAEQHKRYTDWKQHGVTIEMYYGNGTVD